MAIDEGFVHKACPLDVGRRGRGGGGAAAAGGVAELDGAGTVVGAGGVSLIAGDTKVTGEPGAKVPRLMRVTSTYQPARLDVRLFGVPMA